MHVTRQEKTSVDIEIRPFAEGDYDAVVAVSNAVFPDRPTTVEEWRYDDEHFDRTKYVWERYVAVARRSGEVVGYAGLHNVPWNYHPQKFAANVRVHPQHRHRGIGTRLWEQVLASLQRRNAVAVRTTIQESMIEGLRFASRLGFVEQMRMWESRLDVNGCDLAQFRPAVKRAEASGARITTLAEELARDPTALPRIYALNTDIGADTPQPDRFTPPDFQMFVSHFVESPGAIQDAFFLAVVNDDYAGFSNLQKPKQGDWLNQGTTGVRRAYRGRGIATALKVKTVEYAKAHGVREIRTWNEIRNTGILAINDRFRFVRQPPWITFVKEF